MQTVPNVNFVVPLLTGMSMVSWNLCILFMFHYWFDLLNMTFELGSTASLGSLDETLEQATISTLWVIN